MHRYAGIILPGGSDASSILFDLATYTQAEGFTYKPVELTDYIDFGATMTPYAVTFNTAGTALAIGFYSSPYIQVINFSTPGYNPLFASPSPLPGARVTGIAFTHADDAIITVSNSSDRLCAYHWDNTTGFGSKYTAPATPLPGAATGVIITDDDSRIIVTHSTSPYISVYEWNSTTGFGAKLANPSVLLTSTPQNAALSPDGNAVVVSLVASPYIAAYAFSSSGLGTKYANPSVLPSAAATYSGVTFSPNGGAVVLAHNVSSSSVAPVSAWTWNNATGFGSKYSSPSETLGTPGQLNTARRAVFTPDGDLAVAMGSSNKFVYVLGWDDSTGFGTIKSSYKTGTDWEGQAAYGIAFSPLEYEDNGGGGGETGLVGISVSVEGTWKQVQSIHVVKNGEFVEVDMTKAVPGGGYTGPDYCNGLNVLFGIVSKPVAFYTSNE